MNDTPYIQNGLAADAHRLYYSEPSIARKIPATVRAGLGILEHGTLLAKNTSAGTDGKLIPYNPTAVTGAEYAPGRAYLVADSGTANKLLDVTLADSYKFAVGDDLMLNDSTTTGENLGAITAIARGAYKATITVTSNIGATSFTTARFAHVYVEGGDAAVGILEKSVDTGTGVNAKGANTVLLLGNAVLYQDVVRPLDAAAKTDLSAVAIGRFINIP
ncbi:MAG: hypothetical protein KAH38_08195 [Candidatus Hydrogenedentes bacterium]|nr:hypothetical protein [Candidatus Hydrogenedentota bacterium]